MIEKTLASDIGKSAERHLKEMEAISDFIFKNPELGGEEQISCAYLMDIAKNLGLTVTAHYCGPVSYTHL